MTPDQQNELTLVYLREFPCPAIAVKMTCKKTWRLMQEDGYTTQRVDHEADAAATLGVLRAARSWDPGGGASFKTWAVSLVRYEVQLHYKIYHKCDPARIRKRLLLSSVRPDSWDWSRLAWENLAGFSDKDADPGVADFVKAVLKALTPLQLRYVTGYFGLGEAPKSMRAMARLRSVSPAAVSLSVRLALAKMKKAAPQYADLLPEKKL